MKFRIEPDLKYCPQCQDEYRANVEMCVSCSVALLTGREILEIEERRKEKKANRSMHIQPDEELVDIRKGSILEIKQVQALLARQGFPSLIAGDSKSCGKGCRGTEVLLRVRGEDIKEILAIFQKEYIQATALHEHDVSYVDAVYNPAAGKTTCPACGYTFTSQDNCCPDCGLCF
ncbi:MAG: hypothetical protein SCH71_02625 [Desulfobulbaceae bacterium]|nr:hypothetical protein [Desulfobulbaceae bacterium]